MPAAQLPPNDGNLFFDTYYLRAWAYDKANNPAYSGLKSFKVVPVPVTTVRSCVAEASPDTVTLEFQGAVPLSFSVHVNGNFVNIGGVSPDGQTVTLFLPDGSLEIGDEVSVNWQYGTLYGTAQTIAK